jgi:hypothetical protein
MTDSPEHPSNRRLAALWAALTRAERASLSNGLCGRPDTARSLAEKGLATNITVTTRADERVAFIELTGRGEALHANYCIIETDS